MCIDDDTDGETGGMIGPPIEDLFNVDEDPVDFTSAESFPASDPPPPQSIIPPSDPAEEKHSAEIENPDDWDGPRTEHSAQE